MKEAHILALSGGKDSTALALHIKKNYPNIHKKIQYVFYDTGCDLKETYDYLHKIEVYLNKEITYIKPEVSFEDMLNKTKMIPTIFRRWCTIELKIKPSNKFLKHKIQDEKIDKIKLYVGIRSDEKHRKGIVLKTNFEKRYIEPIYLFIKDGITKSDVENILLNSGINYPDYYTWRKRNGCFFCPYQTIYDWICLYENHPDLFYKAMEYEKIGDIGNNIKFRFNPKMSLEEILKNIDTLKYKEKLKNIKLRNENKLIDVW